MNKRRLGNEKEALAAGFREAQGYQIIQKNFYCRQGEIDLIARDGEYLVFVEVKYRVDTSRGWAAQAVDIRKQRRISRAAGYYLYREKMGTDQACRFDVVAIDGDRITLYKHAFPYRK